MDAGGSPTGLSLSDLLPQRRFFRAADMRISSCCTNPAICREGDLYVATPRLDQDEHEGVIEAAERGAIGVLCERLLPLDIPQCIVPNAQAAHAAICQGLAGFPSRKLPVVGIAGTGDLTACALLYEQIQKYDGVPTAAFNGLYYTQGFDAIPRNMRTSTTAQHAQWLATSLANGCHTAVVELPRREVLNHTFAATRLTALMLSQLQSTTQRNRKIPANTSYFERLVCNLETDGLLVANVDCPVVAELLATVERPVLTVSATGAPADLSATLMERSSCEQTFLLQAGYDTVAVRTRVVGSSHIHACLLAAATALSHGVDLSTIVKALESIESIPGHLQRIECGQPFSVFVDGAVSTADFQLTLSTLRQVTEGRLICLFGEGTPQQHRSRARRGRVAERMADLAIITSDNPQDRQALRATHDILDGFCRPAAAHVMPNRIHAIEWALAQCKPGDTLLLAGPHNRCLSRSETDYPADSDTAKFWLYESASDVDIDWILPR